jgi:hypothetical protein
MANKPRHSTTKSCNLDTYHKNNGLSPDKTATARQEIGVGTRIDTKTVYKLAYSFVSGWAMLCTSKSFNGSFVTLSLISKLCVQSHGDTVTHFRN